MSARAAHREVGAPPTPFGGAPERTGPAVLRMLATLLHVTVVTTVILVGVGTIPRLVLGTATSGRAATIEDAERRLGARLLIPGYFPERLAWPPADIHVAGGRHGSAALVFAAQDAGPPVVLVESLEAGEPIHPELLRGRSVVTERPTRIGARPAALASVLVEGVSWQELSFEVNGRAVLLRTRSDDLEELVRMAKTLHVEGGR
jgi:hypothetical protein